MIRVAFVVGDHRPEQLRLREDNARSYSSAEVVLLPATRRPMSVRHLPYSGIATPDAIRRTSNGLAS
jgi:hypothetical protein